MANKYRLARGIQAAQKALTLLVLFCFLIQPTATLAAMVTGIPIQSGTDSTTSSPTTPSSDASSNQTPALDTTATPPATTPVITGTTDTSESAPSTDSVQAPTTQSAVTPQAPPPPSGAAPAPDLTKVTLDSSFHSETDPVTGSLSYTFPIQIPPGRNGLQPSVDLKYTSQPSPNVNILGYGWDAGIPFIERLNKQGTGTLYSQNYFYSSIDGELYPTSASSTTYGAKIENGNFNQYQFTASSTYWTLSDKSGNVYTFGSTTAAQENDASTTTHVYKWMLQSEQDTNGNYITYQYFKDKGELYPSKITYTNASSTPGIYELDYATTTRADIATSSAAGFPITSGFLINHIQIKVNGVLARDYTLSYSAGVNTARSLLSSIVETGYDNGATTTLPATTFTYKTSPKNWGQSATYVPPVAFTSGPALADLNGDSLVDFGSINSSSGTSTVYINTGTNWVASTTLSMATTTGIGGFVDVNGDGIIDEVQTQGTGTYLGTGNGGWIGSSTWSIPSAVATDPSSGSIHYVDVNGDGLTDIIGSADGSSFVYLNNGAGWTLSSTTIPVDFETGGLDDYVRIVDVNGDGLPDLVQSYNLSTGSSNKIWINNGTGWVLDSQWSVPVSMSQYINSFDWYDTGVRFADINGDGLPDIIQNWASSGLGTSTAWINTGSGWVTDTHWLPPVAFSTDNTTDELRIADVNGDNMPDLVRADALGGSLVYINNASTPDLLAKVTYPQGGSANYTYQSSQLYKNGTQALSPQLPISIDTVSSISLDNGLGVVASTSYSYQSGKYYYANALNRQFAGFQKVVKTDSAGNVTNTYYHQGNAVSDTAHGEYQDDLTKIGKAYRTESYDNANNLYNKSIFKWDKTTLSGGRTFVYPDQEVDSTYDGSASHKDKAVSYTYDLTSGSPLSTTNWGQVTGSDDGTFTDTGTDKYTASTTYATSTSPYLVLPDDTITTDQNNNKVNEEQNYYDSSALGTVSLGNLTKQAQWISGTSSPLYASSTIAYNSLGLVTSKKDARGNQTSYGYDAYNMYATSTTNALGEISTTTYDYIFGKVATSTYPNGSKYASVYDGLGRLLLQYQPDTSATTSAPVLATQYLYSDTAFPSIFKTQYLSAASSTEQYAYFDGFGRIVQSRTGVATTTNNTVFTPNVTYLIVAGGGGGGSELAGGGGAGGYLTGSTAVSATSYTVTVGSGGAGGATGGGHAGANGSNSSVNFDSGTLTAIGGGGGGSDSSLTEVGKSGGSGGGGGGPQGTSNPAGGSGTAGQGNTGGKAAGVSGQAWSTGGGGGGAGGVGSDAVANGQAGNGGNGLSFNPGSGPVTYAGGGGGAADGRSGSTVVGAGGTGGGGAGGRNANGTAGTANTGGGGGGAGYTGEAGGNGGSGVVIISYPTGGITATCTGTQTTGGGNTICTLASSTTFTVNSVPSGLPPPPPPIGDTTVKDYQYNNLGLLGQESLPYFDNGLSKTSPTANSNLYTVYAYDPTQRVKSVTNAVGSTTYAYNQWTTTITDANGHPKDLAYDAYGNLVAVTEHNGVSTSTTQYVYDGNKNLIQLTDAAGNVRNFTYDGLSRELSSQDLHIATDTSFGTWTYSYDLAGNKTSSLNPNSQTVNYTYDALNRPLTEDYTGTNGVEKTYTYDTCLNGIGQLCSVGTASATTTYQYDPVGHTIKETEAINGGGTFVTQYSFDRLGNLLTQTYPDSSTVTYLYGSNGLLQAINEQENGSSTTQPIVTSLAYGPDNQVTYQSNGNGTQTFNTYDSNALYRLKYRKTTSPGVGISQLQFLALQGPTPKLTESIATSTSTSTQSDFTLASSTNPIEVLSARTPTSQTFAIGKNAQGNMLYKTNFHASPVFANDGSGNLVPITAPVVTTDANHNASFSTGGYTAQLQANPLPTIFSLSSNQGSFNVGLDDSKTNSTIQSPTSANSAQGPVYTYHNVFGTTVNLEVIASTKYFQKNLVFTSAPIQVGTNPNYTATFKLTAATPLDIQVDGKLLSQYGTLTSTSQAEIKNASGAISYILPPSAHQSGPDSNSKYRIPLSVTYQLNSDGSIDITKQIPYSWLSAATYPVRADLTFSTYDGNGDGNVMTQPQPGSWATQHADTVGQNALSGNVSMYVSSYAYDTSTGYLGMERDFFPFDTSSLPDNAVVSSSTLNLFVNNVINNFADGYNTINVYQGFEASPTQVVNSDISKCGNAITNPTKGSTDLSISSTTASSTISFSLNSTGLNWASTTGYTQLCIREGHDAANQPLVYTGDTSLESGVAFATSETASTTQEPSLSLTYSIPNATPATSTQLQAEDQTNPINLIDQQPRFSAQYNDPDVGDVAKNYELQLATSSTSFASPLWDSGKLSLSPNVNQGYQSQDVSYTGTALALDSSKYYWRIKFWDAGGLAGPWSSGADNFTMANDQTHVQSLHYTYDAVGNITGILDDVNGSEQSTFTYDPLNRLTVASTTVTGGQTPYIRTYAYDPLGNLTSSDQGTYLYQGNVGTNYANPDAVTGIVSTATTTLGYDNNGNLLSDGTYNYAWDYLNEMTQAGKGGLASTTYAYDYSGYKVKKTTPTSTTYSPNKFYSVLATTTPIYTKNIYANGLLVATINSTGTTSAATSTPLLNATSTNFTLTAVGTTTKSWQHTVSFGINRLLVLTASILQSVAGTGSISSATFAGLPLTKAATTRNGTTESELWYLLAPPSGTNTISVSTVGTTSAMKFSLSDYTNLSPYGLDATSTATSSSGSPSVSVTTHLSSDLVLSTLARNSSTTAITNRASIFNDTSSTTLAAASYQVSGAAGSISDTYTGIASQNWAMSIAAFKAATTTPTTGTTTAIKYMHPDHLGGVNAVTDSAGLLAETLQYYPYGALRADTLNGSFSGSGKKYLSQNFDATDGLNDLNARFEQGTRGQFISEDPIFLGNANQQILLNPQSLNAYSYSLDNPISASDPTGLQSSLTQAQQSKIQYEIYNLQLQLIELEFQQLVQSTIGDPSRAAFQGFINPINGYSTAANTSNSTQVRVAGYIGAVAGVGLTIAQPEKGATEVPAASSAIGATGKYGEAALQDIVGGTSQKYFPTSLGKRYVDQYAGGIINEAKTGYQSLTTGNALQIAKDQAIVAGNQYSEVTGAAWHFFTSSVTNLAGPSAPLENALIQAGISVFKH